MNSESKPAGDDLLAQAKFYEYGQKMKLLANRRSQSGRHPDALKILSTGAAELLKHNEINEAYELLGKWVEILEEHPELFTKESESTSHIKSQKH